MRSSLLFIGIAWLVVVIVCLIIGPGLSIGIRSPIQTMRGTMLMGMLMVCLYGLFLTGWVIPLGFGIFGFLRRR